jgi:hypothetical protein
MLISIFGNGSVDELIAVCDMISFMVVLKAHFDGKVFVPDEPVSLAPNQDVELTVNLAKAQTPSDAVQRRLDYWSSRIGIAATPGQKPHDPGADEDALWEKGYLPGSPGCKSAEGE